MKTILLASVGVLALGVVQASAADIARRRPTAGEGAGLCRAALHLDRRLCRHQRRLRLRPFGFLDAVRHRLIRHVRRAGRRHARLQLSSQPARVRHRRRPRRELDQGLGGLRRLDLRNQEQLARHGARPARLRGRAFHALYHRRRRLRRHQDLDHRHRQRDRDQGRLDRRRRRRIRRSTGRGAPSSNISMSISAAAARSAVPTAKLQDNIVRAGVNYRF